MWKPGSDHVARKRRRRGGMSGIRKVVRKFGSGVGSAIIIVGASHGIIGTVRDTMADGNFGAVPNRLSYYYTGFDPGTGGWNQQQAINSAGAILGSLAAGMIVKWAARHT